MQEEAELLARQEAYEKAAAEPVVIDATPRPLPPDLNKALETVTEREEEEETGTGIYNILYINEITRIILYNILLQIFKSCLRIG